MTDNELHTKSVQCSLCSSNVHSLGAMDKEQGQRIDPAFVDGTVLDCKTAKALPKNNRQTWQISHAQNVLNPVGNKVHGRIIKNL